MLDAKTCSTCGRLFRRRDNEKPATFRLRKRCGFYCRPVTRPDKTGRARAERLYDGQPCAVCGMAYGGRGRVDRHHIDSDRMNNSAENIALLCRKHHMAAHREGDGQVGGGPRPSVTFRQRRAAISRAISAKRLLDQGMPMDEAARQVGVSSYSIYRYMRKYAAEL